MVNQHNFLDRRRLQAHLTHNQGTENASNQTGQVESPLSSDDVDEKTEKEGADSQA